MIFPKGWKRHYQASKENYSRCSNCDCVERGGQDIPSFHKQCSSIPFISVCNNVQYPYLWIYNPAPHNKRKEHTPSWPPAMTLSTAIPTKPSNWKALERRPATQHSASSSGPSPISSRTRQFLPGLDPYQP